MVEVEIPWIKRLEEKAEKPDEIEDVDYEVMLEELEFR